MSEHTNRLVAEMASRTLEMLHRPYPSAALMRFRADDDAVPPRILHPAFFGCFDWHSSVHSHWQLVRVLRMWPSLAPAGAAAALDSSLRPANIAAEVDAIDRSPGFETPYGMAWVLQLAAEVAEWGHDRALGWGAALAPLEELAADRVIRHLERLPYPNRTGNHAQTAFATALAWDWARLRRPSLAERFAETALGFFLEDREAPLEYEPSGNDFLSPGLAEADLMRRVLPSASFGSWLSGFLGSTPVDRRLAPVEVVDPSDGQLAHFAGLNLSRAWMAEGVATALSPEHPARPGLERLGAAHRSAGLGGAAHPDYMVSHWVPSFAVYLLSSRGLRWR